MLGARPAGARAAPLVRVADGAALSAGHDRRRKRAGRTLVTAAAAVGVRRGSVAIRSVAPPWRGAAATRGVAPALVATVGAEVASRRAAVVRAAACAVAVGVPLRDVAGVPVRLAVRRRRA